MTARAVAVWLAISGMLASASTALAVQGGHEDSATAHSVAIATGGPTSPVMRCSGTLISPNVVLTVRHCVAQLSIDAASCGNTFGEAKGAPGEFWVDATPWVAPGLTWKKVASWELPIPREICGNDIALLVLATPFAESEAVPARPLLDTALVLDAARRRRFGFAAFGATSPAGEGVGTRRSRLDVPVKCIPGEPGFECDSAFGYIDAREFTGGAGPCGGDSGGGAMTDDDRGTIFGVLSRGGVKGDACTEGVFERTDYWRWLIARTVLRATPTGTTPPAWASAAFPERPGVGELCDETHACAADARCVSLDGHRSFVCARRCSAGCSAGERCDSEVCVAHPALLANDGGCRTAPHLGRATPKTVLIIGLIAALLTCARRRSCHRGVTASRQSSSRSARRP
ncbi:MAG: trypsin-like serine protease [Labilithrix sp.]|nr:trypsin-like serine protease [Labilithrix sp.]